MALAVAALADRDVNRLILTRPAVEAGERLGFLPGDMLAKVDPYLRPLFDALYDMLDADRLNAFMERGTIEVAPLAFMRGRTLNDSFIILDEAQNTTPEQMQMFLTRLGFGSKVVVTGDVTQIDLPQDQASGLIHVRQILGDIDGIEFVEFGQPGRRAPRARPAHRRGVQAPRRGDGHAAAPVIRIEIANESGVAVDEAAVAERSPARVLAAEGIEDGDLGHRVRGAGADARAQARAPRASTRRRTSSRSRSTAATSSRLGCRASSATSSSAPRWSARPGGRRSSTGCSTCSATSHGTEMERRERTHVA